MPVEDVFTITGRGTVATGRIEQGKVNVGDEVELVGIQPETTKTVVTGVEMFRKLLDYGQAGDNVGCLLRGTKREDIQRGQVLAKPGSITPHTKFKAEVYCLTKEEGGRHTPFFNGYRPQFYFRTTDVTGVCQLPEGTEMVMPGDNTQMEIELIQPIAMDEAAALRHPRGRPDGRLGGGHRDHRVGDREAGDEPALRQGDGYDRGGALQGASPHAHDAADKKANGSDTTEQDPDQAQGVRPRRHRSGCRRDRGDGGAHRRDGVRPRSAAHGEERLRRDPQPVQGQGLARALRDPHAQAPDRHPSAHPKTVDSLQRLDHLPAGVDIEIRL